jgi:hypothetical protein
MAMLTPNKIYYQYNIFVYLEYEGWVDIDVHLFFFRDMVKWCKRNFPNRPVKFVLKATTGAELDARAIKLTTIEEINARESMYE